MWKFISLLILPYLYKWWNFQLLYKWWNCVSSINIIYKWWNFVSSFNIIYKWWNFVSFCNIFVNDGILSHPSVYLYMMEIISSFIIIYNWWNFVSSFNIVQIKWGISWECNGSISLDPSTLIVPFFFLTIW